MGKADILVLTIEECSELTQAICKFQRVLDEDTTCAKTFIEAYANFVEEIADVESCLEQLKNRFCILQDNVDMIKDQKNKRTKRRSISGNF